MKHLASGRQVFRRSNCQKHRSVTAFTRHSSEALIDVDDPFRLVCAQCIHDFVVKTVGNGTIAGGCLAQEAMTKISACYKSNAPANFIGGFADARTKLQM